MRFAVYNIRYGTGAGRPVSPFGGYLGRTGENLARIIEFLRDVDADVIGLLEVDGGSYRSGGKNQAALVAEALGHYHTYRSKYGHGSVFRRLPLFSKQGNAFVTRDTIQNERFHYFEHGTKRLVIELELESVALFLVHLGLRPWVRRRQLSDLEALVKQARKPHIVAGDFNALLGEHEVHEFLAATGLLNANRASAPLFPSWAPRRHLDFVLHSPEIAVQRFDIPAVPLSDHLPLVCDFALQSGLSDGGLSVPGIAV